MVYADLHVHTNYSDGTHSIEEVIRLAKNRGIKVVAITDHDTLYHYDKVKKICEKNNIKTIRGVEMSCYDFDVYKKVHVVGLWLNDKGLDITYEEAKKFSPYNIVFKMHLFQAIVNKYPEYNNLEKYRELFAGKVSQDVDLQMGYIDVKSGIEAIHKDGGIAILAHPCEYDNYDEIKKYVSYDLDGIEISHPSMKEDDYPLTQHFAKKYNLLKSGGSDFHNIKLTSIGDFGLTKEQFDDLEKEALQK